MVAAVFVIGVGNRLRHDDAAGLEVVRRARALAGAAPGEGNAGAIGFREQERETLALIDAWEGAKAVVLADALHGLGPVGAVYRFDASETPLPVSVRSSASTHALGVGEAIELARALGRLPRRVVVYGVAGARFDSGEGLSGEVSEQLDGLARRVLAEAYRLAPGGARRQAPGAA